MGDWISVKDRLPEMKELYSGGPKDVSVIAFTGHYVCEAKLGETYKKRTPRWTGHYGRAINVTHWMPLPDPPEAQS